MEKNNITEYTGKAVDIALTKRDLILIHASLILGLKGFVKDEINAIQNPLHDNNIGVYKKGFNDTLILYARIRNIMNVININGNEE